MNREVLYGEEIKISYPKRCWSRSEAWEHLIWRPPKPTNPYRKEHTQKYWVWRVDTIAMNEHSKNNI